MNGRCCQRSAKLRSRVDFVADLRRRCEYSRRRLRRDMEIPSQLVCNHVANLSTVFPERTLPIISRPVASINRLKGLIGGFSGIFHKIATRAIWALPRTSRSEASNSKQIRSTKFKIRNNSLRGLEFGISVFGFVSDFGFRFWNFWTKPTISAQIGP